MSTCKVHSTQAAYVRSTRPVAKLPYLSDCKHFPDEWGKLRVELVTIEPIRTSQSVTSDASDNSRIGGVALEGH